MQIKSNVRMLYSRVQTMLRQRRRKQLATSKPEISAPFDFKHVPVAINGVTEDELSILREKAAASRIGVAETMPRSPVLSFVSNKPSTPTMRTRTPTAHTPMSF